MRFATLSLFLLGACGAAAHPTTSTTTTTPDNHAPVDAPAGPSIRSIDWKNYTYDLGEEGKYKVVNGELEFAYDANGNQVPPDYQPKNPDEYVEHGFFNVSDPVFGDVTRDGVEDAIIVSVLNTGGTGQFSSVAVYTMKGGVPVEIGGIPGGDRGDGGISDVKIDNGIVMVDRLESGPDDGACCPSLVQHEQWTWNGKEFVENQGARTTTKNDQQ